MVFESSFLLNERTDKYRPHPPSTRKHIKLKKPFGHNYDENVDNKPSVDSDTFKDNFDEPVGVAEDSGQFQPLNLC